MVDAPVSIDIPNELSAPVEYPTCGYKTNIQLAECIQGTRSALDIANKNIEAIISMVASAVAASR